MIVRIGKLSLILLIMIVVLQIPLLSGKTRAAPVAATNTPLTNLDDDASQWGIFQDHGSVQGTVTNVAHSSADGSALVASLLGGQPYTGMHVYRNMGAIDDATTFELTLSFKFTNPSAVQALEFTTSKWVQNTRWEWALQWENVGDGGPQQGAPPTWRLWTGSSWQNTGIQQSLSARTWHTLHLFGDISNGNVHYVSFQCDQTQANLSQVFAPVVSAGDKIAVAVQLDGNGHENSYQMYLDEVSLAVNGTGTQSTGSAKQKMGAMPKK